MVDRHAQDANSKCGTLTACRVYLAKRSTDRQFFNVYTCTRAWGKITYVYYMCVYVDLYTTLKLPPERPRLQLQPRTKSLGSTSGGRERGEGGRASSSIFGQAKPVDTAAREREIEERLLR